MKLFSIIWANLSLYFLSQLIKNLEAEKEELKKNLNLAESKTNNIKDEQKTETLESLLESKGNKRF